MADTPNLPASQQQLPGEDIQQALDQLAELVSDSLPPIPADTLRRENMYSREDEQR